MYDAIIVGARCAGSPTAMLLARKGYRVLLVDKATFPSDVVNGYYLHQTAVARLKRWGLLDKLRACNCPPLLTLTFDFGDFAVEGYSPRRAVLDKLLVEAAEEAGTELREGFAVQELVWDGACVAGIRGRAQGGATVTERARIVIGADGRHSCVARTVKAPAYHVQPALTCWYYTHWSDVPAEGVEIYLRDRRMLIACRTNDADFSVS
jgi:flavin-dependent dehydrogenase